MIRSVISYNFYSFFKPTKTCFCFLHWACEMLNLWKVKTAWRLIFVPTRVIRNTRGTTSLIKKTRFDWLDLLNLNWRLLLFIVGCMRLILLYTLNKKNNSKSFVKKYSLKISHLKCFLEIWNFICMTCALVMTASIFFVFETWIPIVCFEMDMDTTKVNFISQSDFDLFNNGTFLRHTQGIHSWGTCSNSNNCHIFTFFLFITRFVKELRYLCVIFGNIIWLVWILRIVSFHWSYITLVL